MRRSPTDARWIVPSVRSIAVRPGAFVLLPHEDVTGAAGPLVGYADHSPSATRLPQWVRMYSAVRVGHGAQHEGGINAPGRGKEPAASNEEVLDVVYAPVAIAYRAKRVLAHHRAAHDVHRTGIPVPNLLGAGRLKDRTALLHGMVEQFVGVGGKGMHHLRLGKTEAVLRRAQLDAVLLLCAGLSDQCHRGQVLSRPVHACATIKKMKHKRMQEIDYANIHPRNAQSAG